MMKSNNRILLIRPQNIYNYNNYPPLGLLSVASVLKNEGFEPVIINAFSEKDIFQTLKCNLQDKPLFVGVGFLTSEVSDAYRIVNFIKENSDVPVVVGGWHCTLFPEQMANSDLVDYVISAEAESHITELARELQNGARPLRKIFPKKFYDIEKLPLTEYSLDRNIERFITGYLTDKLSEYVCQPMRWLPYESSRGCPSQCSFCINTVSGNVRYRKKSAQKVVSEIEAIVRKFRLTHLKIIDDNFFVDIERVKNIAEGILNKNLKITWDGECRCDYFNERMINDETLSLLKKSGLIQLTLGIESGSVHSLDLMKKGISPKQAEFAVSECNRHGIIARSSFMLEVPGENIQDIKETVRFINRLRKYPYFTCGVGTFRPYPKCELTAALISKGFLKEPEGFADWSNPEIIEMYTSAEYIRPWQTNGKYSESAAYYLNMESAVRLGNYQIDNTVDRLKNSFFVHIARLRNRLTFYQLSLDKKWYKHFLKNFYARRQDLEKAGAYPVSRAN